jgi:hypothetical protein
MVAALPPGPGLLLNRLLLINEIIVFNVFYGLWGLEYNKLIRLILLTAQLGPLKQGLRKEKAYGNSSSFQHTYCRAFGWGFNIQRMYLDY